MLHLLSHLREEGGLTGSSCTVVMLAVASFFSFGYATGVISGAGPLIEISEGMSTLMDDALVVSTVVGAALGAGIGGPLADWKGRRITITLSAIVSLFATVGSALSPSVLTLVVARCFVGFGIGLSFNTVPLYAAECVPTSIRGVVVDLSDFSTVTGQLISAIVNGSCATFLPYELAWRVSLGIGGLAALCVCRLAYLCPESPRFLCANLEDDDAARIVLRNLRGGEGKESRCSSKDTRGESSQDSFSPEDTLRRQVEEELDAIKEQVALEREANALLSVTSLFASKRVRRALYLGLGLQTLNQLTGINTAMYYGGVILEEAGFGLLASIWCTVALTAVQLIGVGISVNTIDAKGRRFTALRSLALVIPSLIFLGLGFALNNTIIVVVFLSSYLLAFGSGLSGVSYVVNSEIYPSLIRGRCYSIGGALFWFENTIVSLGFPLLSDSLGAQYPFWGFAAVGIIGFYFLWYYLPETTNRPLEHIDAFFTAEPYPKPWHLAGFNGITNAHKVTGDLATSLLAGASSENLFRRDNEAGDNTTIFKQKNNRENNNGDDDTDAQSLKTVDQHTNWADNDTSPSIDEHQSNFSN